MKIFIHLLFIAGVLLIGRLISSWYNFYTVLMFVGVCAFGTFTTFWLYQERKMALIPAGAEDARKVWKWVGRFLALFFVSPQLSRIGDPVFSLIDLLFFAATYGDELKWLGRNTIAMAIYSIASIVLGSYFWFNDKWEYSLMSLATGLIGVAALGTLSSKWSGAERGVGMTFLIRFTVFAIAAYSARMFWFGVAEGVSALAVAIVILFVKRP